MVRPDDSAVDHLDRLADLFGIVERLQNDVSDARECPPTELPINHRPLAKELREIAPLHASPGYPENAVEDKTVIARTATTMGPLGNDEGLKECPFIVAHQASDQARLLPKATLNHEADRTGILFVNGS